MRSARSFFDDLAGRRDEPALRNLSGTIRFDLRRNGTTDPWFVEIHDGNVAIARRKARADCVASMNEDTFSALGSGEMNAIAATLRGDIEVEGEVALLLAFQRLFPGPPANSPHQDVGRSR